MKRNIHAPLFQEHALPSFLPKADFLTHAQDPLPECLFFVSIVLISTFFKVWELVAHTLTKKFVFTCITKPFYKQSIIKKSLLTRKHTCTAAYLSFSFYIEKKIINSMKFVKHIIWMKYHPQVFVKVRIFFFPFSFPPTAASILMLPF